MARLKKVSIGAINITMHPHTPERYVDLFKMARRKKLIGRISKERAGTIGSVYAHDKRKGYLSPLEGEIYKFSDIDMDGDWYNTDTSQHAEDDDLESISIPDHLKPNSIKFFYLFYPESHTLYYENYRDSNALSAASALKIISQIFNNDELGEEFGLVDCTIVPSRDEFEHAISTHKISKLTIILNRPNPDDWGNLEQEILDRLEEENVAQLRQVMKAIPGKNIEPNEQTINLARVASTNGKVEVIGSDESGNRVEFVTDEHPWTESNKYDPDQMTGEAAFEDAVEKARN